ncbi:hypothetical protein ASG73_03965 [Janibacter sp. Soil728]|uniref:SPW repeat protein n=1 Tax=Janibacter sp. Soil728 TaxID=1736393 RepID=UPI0006FA2628|nr:SPW repeat protein [Janibacter sp. Soil728]KRE39479.1 hypothetical protein ASG73_03965 [Janibacter sp. Soil728]
MNTSTRWQDWVALIAGAVALLAPLVTTTEPRATWTMVILGGLTVIASAYSLYTRAGATMSEGSHAFLGVLLFIAPWVMGFTDLSGLAWTAWITGIVAFVVGVLALPQVRASMHHAAPSH